MSRLQLALNLFLCQFLFVSYSAALTSGNYQPERFMHANAHVYNTDFKWWGYYQS